MDALAAVAAKVGPEVSVIHTQLPLEEIPLDTQCAAFSMEAGSLLLF